MDQLERDSAGQESDKHEYHRIRYAASSDDDLLLKPSEVPDKNLAQLIKKSEFQSCSHSKLSKSMSMTGSRPPSAF
jgi:hypothetical protein